MEPAISFEERKLYDQDVTNKTIVKTIKALELL